MLELLSVRVQQARRPGVVGGQEARCQTLCAVTGGQECQEAVVGVVRPGVLWCQECQVGVPEARSARVSGVLWYRPVLWPGQECQVPEAGGQVLWEARPVVVLWCQEARLLARSAVEAEVVLCQVPGGLRGQKCRHRGQLRSRLNWRCRFAVVFSTHYHKELGFTDPVTNPQSTYAESCPAH
ncbi:hypothetical protein KOW79_020483 [Hemibagrus wyckioides]|uniref:Uncharacterized protein n=1 Tax=Hemibagrus wyckioides TaxID=337641 RepID=A0A9D3N752_9TELE|nr:hypothetical protein KOW79_020483 [Hemibagrus wyckioides]